MNRTPEERFWDKVNKTDTCWLWGAYCGPNGYGKFGLRAGKNVLAHRFAWMLTNGPIPDGLHVLHRCDVPPCVRPEHLFLGTRSDNMQDCLAKGRWTTQRRIDARLVGDANPSRRHPERQARGVRLAQAKLTDEKVREIRARYTGRGGETLVSLAAEFGVTFATISHVARRRTWKHVA